MTSSGCLTKHENGSPEMAEDTLRKRRGLKPGPPRGQGPILSTSRQELSKTSETGGTKTERVGIARRRGERPTRPWCFLRRRCSVCRTRFPRLPRRVKEVGKTYPFAGCRAGDDFGGDPQHLQSRRAREHYA